MNQTAAQALPTVTGRVVEKNDEQITLALPGSDYRLHLALNSPLTAEIGELVRGVIRAKARRVDVVPSGGRYIEPLFGRPRRVQGRIIGGDVQANTIHVQAGGIIIAELMAPQKASDFAIGQMASFDVLRGATFEVERDPGTRDQGTEG